MPEPLDRLRVELSLDADKYAAGWRNASATTSRESRAIAGQLGTLSRDTGKHMGSMEKATDRVGRAWSKLAIGAGVAAGGAAIAALGVGAVKAAASFEYEMSRIKAVSGETVKSLEPLRKEVLQLGKDTVFSAGETAQAATELVKAGLSVSQTMAALPGTLAMASAGELDVATSAEYAANTMNMFGLKANEIMGVADALASAANKSSVDVKDLADALAMSGTVAAQAGWSYQQTVAALAEMGNQGIKGSDAGTSLKQMFMQLEGPSGKAADKMKEIGLSVYDANHNMKSAAELIRDMGKAFGPLNEEERNFAMAQIFGSDAVRAANILVGQGVDKFEDMTKAVSVAGEAQRVAAEKLNNLSGDWENLKGSIETFAITVGTRAVPKLRDLAKGLNAGAQEAIDFMDNLEKLPGWGGADLSGKIKLGLAELTTQLETWWNSPSVKKLSSESWATAPGLTGQEQVKQISEQLGRGLVEVIADLGKGTFQFLADVFLEVLGKDTGNVWAAAGVQIAEGFLKGVALGGLEVVWDAALALARRDWHLGNLGKSTSTPPAPEEAGVITFAAKFNVSEKSAIDLLEKAGQLSAETARKMREKMAAGIKLGEPGVADAGEKLIDAANKGMGKGLVGGEKTLQDIASKSGASVADALADGLASKSSYVAGVINSYGTMLANGLKPVIKMVGGSPVVFQSYEQSIGHWADGGFRLPAEATIERAHGGAGLVQWVEPVTQGEAFIPLAPSKRKRSIQIWQETGRRLGMQGDLGESHAFANGGFRSTADVPAVPRFAQDIASTGAAAARMMRTAVVDYLAKVLAQMAPDGAVLTGGSGIRGQIIALAASKLGKPYVWGATGPNAFDCSGLVQWVYNRVGLSIPRVAADQQKTGHAVNQNSALPGDLTYYGNPAYHTAIYAGNGTTIEAKGRRWGVVRSSAFRSGFSGVRSHFNDNPIHMANGGIRTFDTGGVLPPGTTIAQNYTGSAEAILTELQVSKLNELVGGMKDVVQAIRDAVNADKSVPEGEKGKARDERLAALWGDRSGLASSYVGREEARLRAMQALGAGIDAQMAVQERKIMFLDQAVAEKAAQLQQAKDLGMDQKVINELATELFDLSASAADARKALEDLARVPLENAAAGWSNSISMLNDQLDLLGNSSNASALLNAAMPNQLGLMGGQYQSTMDLMNSPGQSADQVRALGQQASSQIMGMFNVSKGALDRTLQDTLSSIDADEKAWLATYEANGIALEAQLESETKAITKQFDKQREANQQRVADLQKSQQAALDALRKGYDDRLLAMQDGERAITREEQRNRDAKSLGKTENELRILQGQGFYTEADIARMRELETQAQDQRDAMAQQDAAWAREDARTALERQRDAALSALELQQQSAMEMLQAQVKAEDERLAAQEEAALARIEAQRTAYEQERIAQAKAYQDQRDAAQAAYQAQLDALVTQYAAMLQEVQTKQQELLAALGQTNDYQNSGYQLGLAFAAGLAAAQQAVRDAAVLLGTTAQDNLQLNSPAKKGPLSTLDHWWDAFAPTLIRPLRTSDLLQPIMDTLGPSAVTVKQQSAVTVRVLLEGSAVAPQDIPTLARELSPYISQQINSNVRIAGLSYGG